MNKDTLLGFVRHALTFGGGFAVAKGLIDPEMLTEVVGAVVTLVGVVMSALDKKNRNA